MRDSTLSLAYPVVGQGVRHESRLQTRPGVTLLELIVVLSLLGFLLAVAAPAFVVPTEKKKDAGISAVLESAQRTAILRAEPVTLVVDADGGWRLDAPATAGTSQLAAGKLEPSPGALRIQVSALGTCVVTSAAASVPGWNALRCRADVPLERAGR